MNKEVRIKIKTIQSVDEEDGEVTELFTFGKLSRLKDSDGYRIVYDETEVMGFEGCRVALDVTDSFVKMSRTGKASSTLFIEKGKKHHGHYGTPFGDFMIGINADELKNGIGDNGGNLYMKYTIDVNSDFLSENEIFVNVEECNGKV